MGGFFQVASQRVPSFQLLILILLLGEQTDTSALGRYIRHGHFLIEICLQIETSGLFGIVEIPSPIELPLHQLDMWSRFHIIEDISSWIHIVKRSGSLNTWGLAQKNIRSKP